MKFFYASLLIACLLTFGCGDEQQQMLKPVIQEVVPDVPTGTETPTVDAQYDVNQDGVVDNTDLTLVSGAIGQSPPTNPRLDVDGSGTVDGTDIILVSNNFGKVAPSTEDTPPTRGETPPTRDETPAVYSQYDVNQDGVVDSTDSALVSAALGQTQPTNPRLDVDGSGTVDGNDFILVNSNLGAAAPRTEGTPRPEEGTTPERDTGIADIFEDIDLPAEPTIPEGVDVLDSDRVLHFSTEDFRGDSDIWFGGRIDIALGENASRNEDVLTFFRETRAWAEETCGKSGNEDAGILIGYFTFRSRAEREAFKEALPGGWTTDWSDKVSWWRVSDENIYIVDSTDVYYSMGLSATDPCVFGNR